MRVISQNGRYDIPYELFVLGLTQDNCIVAIRDTIARPSEMANGLVAKYSTKAKAIKAMGMLRKAWINESVEFEDGIYHRNTVFQFPQDDEIEV